MRNAIGIFTLLIYITSTHACKKSCTKDLCNTVADVTTAACTIGSLGVSMIPIAGPVLGSAMGIGCIAGGTLVKYGGCGQMNECEGHKPENKEHRENLKKALEGLKKVLKEIGEIKKDTKQLKAELIKQGKEFRKWFEKLDQGVQKILRTQLEQFKKIEVWFRDLKNGQQNLLENQKKLRNAFDEMRAMLVEQFAKNDEWFRKLDENDQEILLGQKDIISKIYGLEQQMAMAQRTLDSIGVTIEEGFLIDFYKVDLKDIIDVIDIFPTLNREISGVFERDSRYETFIDLIMDKFRLEKAVKNVLKMMIGQEFPLKKSIYAIKERKYCDPDVHRKLMLLASEGMKYVLFASRHFASNIKSANEQYQENRVKADEAYVVHCGCPPGSQPYQIKILSDLIPSLPSSSNPINVNFQKLLIRAKNRLQLEKAEILLNYKNFEPTSDIISQIDEFAINHIQIAIDLTEQGLSNWLEYYDGRKSCIQKTALNFIGKYIH